MSGDLFSLGWATTATRHVRLLVLQSRLFGRSELFFSATLQHRPSGIAAIGPA